MITIWSYKGIIRILHQGYMVLVSFFIARPSVTKKKGVERRVKE
jgi:hypothetical protein